MNQHSASLHPAYRAQHSSIPARKPISVQRPKFKTLFRCFEAQIFTTCSGEARYPNYDPIHLLSLPREIRDEIFYLIFEDTVENPNTNLSALRPRNNYDGLQLVCRQLWDEIQLVLSRTYIPCNRIEKFLGQSFDNRIYLNLKTLAIELPFNSHTDYFDGLANAFRYLGNKLENVNLYFFGRDKYGVRTEIHGCGMRDPSSESTSQKLAIEGQGFEERRTLFRNLIFLTHLRSLVISNPQSPLLQGLIICHKPFLENLQIFTDPRQTLHRTFVNTALYPLIVPTSHTYPPIRNLQISANAALTSYSVAAKVVQTLEELSWTVPDSSRQAGTMGGNWLSDTASLLGQLQRFGKKLKVLRICIEGAIYENHHDYGGLIGAFKDSFPRMATLDVLELHLTSKSAWFGMEILESIPKSLKRLHISDKTVQVNDIVQSIPKLYSGPSWRRIEPSQTKTCEDGFSDIDSLPDSEREGIVGEEYIRFDCIRMNDNLGFFGYEFDGAESTELELLKMNGRLLDRERNQHLQAYQRQFIPIRQAPAENRQDNSDETGSVSNHAHDQCYKPKYGETQTVLTQLRMSQFKDDMRYFGGEQEAEKVFMREITAKAESLPKLTMPVIVDVDDSDHWMS